MFCLSFLNFRQQNVTEFTLNLDHTFLRESKLYKLAIRERIFCTFLQGSAKGQFLAPLLFILYIYDIMTSINKTMFFYVLQINQKRFLFDLAVLQAFRDVFPRVILRGFVFHWTQCVYRMVLRLGLSTTYLAVGDTYALIRKLLALPFLPA